VVFLDGLEYFENKVLELGRGRVDDRTERVDGGCTGKLVL